jgi:hypothetical protein
MNELGIQLAADHRQIAHCERISRIGSQRFALGDIDLVISSGVNHKLRIGGGDRFFDASGICNIKGLAVEPNHVPIALLKFAA